jgi:uncharacterized iron-regulated protein
MITMTRQRPHPKAAKREASMAILRFFPMIMCLAILAVTLPLHAQERGKLVDETLRQLEKEITAVRGLEFKMPVNAKVIARPRQGEPGASATGVQGFYSIKEKTLYLYDDIKGNYERGVLIHEMVHALQDQHFGLAQLHQAEFGSDGELAMAALIEGDATFTMIEMLKKEQPKAAMMLDTKLEKAKNLRNAFLYGAGARYVRGVKEKNGWTAVNARYKFPPRTTAAILNPGGSTIDLGPGRSVGAIGMVQSFARSEETKSLMLAAVHGLLADRVIEDGPVKTWQLAFDTDEHADRFVKSYVPFLVSPQIGPKLLIGPPGLQHWRRDDGSTSGVVQRGSRVIAVDAPSELAFRAALDRVEGPPALVIWSAKERRNLTFGELIDRLLDADLICIGENHDSELCHRVQLQIIKAIHASDARLGVGMEMFQRPYQESLDKFVRGEIGEEEMLKATEYRTRWSFHWSLYRPIADFCRKNSVPVAALNAPRELTAKVSKAGFKNLTDEDKKALGPVDFHVKAHRDHWYEFLGQMHGKKASEDQKERSYQVMTIWDDYMAASAATFQTSRFMRRMVVLAGSGHIDLGFGIPQRAIQRTGGRAATVHVAPGGDAKKLFAGPPADYVVIVR